MRLALCMCIARIISETLVENDRDFSISLAFDAPVSGIPVGISPSRLVWMVHGYLTVKNFEDIFSGVDRDINSLDFMINRLFMKLIKTSDINVVRTCQHKFGFELFS